MPQFTIFDGMKFPPHVHREYPKHIPTKETKEGYVVVRDEEEEQAALEKYGSPEPKDEPVAEEQDVPAEEVAQTERSSRRSRRK